MFTMPKKIVGDLKGFISFLFAILTLPYRLKKRLSSHWTSNCFNTFNTNNFRDPFFIIQSFYLLFLHGKGKLDYFRPKLLAMGHFYDGHFQQKTH
jgi:hypothetical protein